MHLAAEADSAVNGEISHYPGFYSALAADQFLHDLLNNHHWPNSNYVVEGRRFSLPRQQSWHADEGVVYSYSNNLLVTRPWTSVLTTIRQEIQKVLGCQFNSVLVNLYRNGDDYVGWHADDEVELGVNPVIASLSFGATRKFSYKSTAADNAGDLHLRHGDLLVMEAGFQSQWLHSVPPDCQVINPRINLTFRYVYPAA